MQLAKCKVSKYCGGCQYQGKSYEEQLKLKQEKIEKLYPNYKVEPIIGMDENPYFYRNKVQYAFGQDERGRIIYGNYVVSTHKIVEVQQCQISDEKADEIVSTIKKLLISFRLTVFDEYEYKGFLRHVLIRTGKKTGQIMVVLVAGTHIFPKKKDFIKELLKLHPEITTVVLNINNRHTSMVLGERNEVLYGKGYIEDILCGKIFKISPNSFYQINSVQTEKLYSTAIELAELNKNEVLLDAYCGIGTIGIIASDNVKEVIGVEINKSAIKDAKINAELNDISNITFFCQDAGKYMTSLKRRIDVVIMDPARAGSDEKFLSSLVRLKAQKVIYVSCNPDTQKRDIAYLLKKGYEIKKIQPVDMFPFTNHCETIALLVHK